MGNNKLKGIVQRNMGGWLLMIPSVLLFFLVVWRPIGIAMTYSFFDLQGFVPKEFVGLQNFKDVLTDTAFISTLKNTVSYVLWSLVFGLPLPFILAVMLNEVTQWRGYFKFTLYLPVVVPAIATAMIWKMIYMEGPGGLLNMIGYVFGAEPRTWLGDKNLVIPLIILSMTWQSYGGAFLTYFATLQGINQELYEAARLDGAGLFSRIRHIMFPYMRGLLFLMMIRQMISVFNVTAQPLTMTGGGPNGASLSIGLTNYYYAFKYGQFDKSMALGVVVFLLLLVFTFIYFGLEKKMDD